MAIHDQADFDSEIHKDDDKRYLPQPELPLPLVSCHIPEVAYSEGHNHQDCIAVVAVDEKVVLVAIDMAVEIVTIIMTNLDDAANVDAMDEEVEKLEGTARSPSWRVYRTFALLDFSGLNVLLLSRWF